MESTIRWLRRWVASYRAHGRAGLRKKFSRYDAQFKMMVLQRMWRDGLSHREVIALFDIRNAGIVGQWERLLDSVKQHGRSATIILAGQRV